MQVDKSDLSEKPYLTFCYPICIMTMSDIHGIYMWTEWGILYLYLPMLTANWCQKLMLSTPGSHKLSWSFKTNCIASDIHR